MVVGRGSERQRIERLLAGARSGVSGVLVLAGEPGIGKTTMLQQARDGVSGMRVISVGGVEAERELAFSGLHQLCGRLLGVARGLPPRQYQALAVALAVNDGPTPDRFAVGAAVLGLIARAAEEDPLAIFIDDAHLLDASSLQAISFAARRLLTDRVAIVAALRNEIDSPLRDLPRMDLGPLGLEDTRTLLAAWNRGSWDAAELARFHAATGGNPLAIIELAGKHGSFGLSPPALPVPLTGRLLDAFSGRIRSLSSAARAVLLLAATDNGDLRMLGAACQAMGVDLGHLSEAEDAGLVSLGNTAVEFRHPLMRAAVYGAAEPAARREAHRLLGNTAIGLESRAWHLAEAAIGPDDAASRLLEAAAVASAGRGANAVAAAQLERAATLAADHGTAFELLVRAGDQCWLAGSSGRAIADLERALAMARTPVEVATATGRLGAIAARCGSLQVARDMQFEAATQMAPRDPDAAILLLADTIDACLYLCDAPSAMRASDGIIALMGPGTSGAARKWGSIAAGVALVLGGRGDRGAGFIRSGMAAHLGNATGPDQWQLRWHLMGPLFLRETGGARKAMTAAVETVRKRAAVGMLPFLLTLVARDDAAAANWAGAEAGYTEAIRIAREDGQSNDLALALAGLAWLEARQGKAGSSALHAEESTVLAVKNSAHLARLWAMFAIADLEAATGDAARAIEAYTGLEKVLEEVGVKDADLMPGAELVECWCRLGDKARAGNVAEGFLAAAEAKGQPWALARAHRALAMAGDEADAVAGFERALAFHAQTPDLFEAARTKLAYGSWLRRSRRRIDARVVLREALDGFERLGAVPWSDRAAAELNATGETAMRREAGALGRLTPQEHQIAALLATGKTTRVAAEGLFLSPKTVEYHLRHIYLKLGIHSREELAAALGAGPDGIRLHP
ncbi:LuxR family transcriptional regulator [Paeniglutamicibacter psychrophenolicus]|uniref:DNA-binding CsgD family transcriptional regulator n=1 Tax=Paeniglutamicibacter psychrophenolicus TaxID=257454 RepID=A0ABS4WF49_9MICC|nr:LuxR family transcriptional regulator [Paeniglutamicibacter psychrophenolicus]MBP2374666.1 DNA-binding CsgD family transcriptional regulator [Paeniglutamicibacter psychrophenolicus]